MRIEDGVVIFKTENRIFDVEKNGKKPYTVRIMNEKELYALMDVRVKRVRIEHAESGNEWFEHDILSAVVLGKIFGQPLVGIAWDPRSGQNEKN